MLYEVRLPGGMTVESMVDRMARAAWCVLAEHPWAWGLYQGYFPAVYAAIQDRLGERLTPEAPVGAGRLRFECGDGDGACLERVLALAVAGRTRDLRHDEDGEARLVDGLTGALREVLESCLWLDRVDARA